MAYRKDKPATGPRLPYGALVQIAVERHKYGDHYADKLQEQLLKQEEKASGVPQG